MWGTKSSTLWLFFFLFIKLSNACLLMVYLGSHTPDACSTAFCKDFFFPGDKVIFFSMSEKLKIEIETSLESKPLPKSKPPSYKYFLLFLSLRRLPKDLSLNLNSLHTQEWSHTPLARSSQMLCHLQDSSLFDLLLLLWFFLCPIERLLIEISGAFSSWTTKLKILVLLLLLSFLCNFPDSVSAGFLIF